MKRLNKVIVIFIFSLIQHGCNQNYKLDKNINFTNDNIAIQCSINELEYNSLNDKLNTFIKGKIEILNTSNDSIIFNLKNVKLSLGNKEIADIYIDSIASINISDEILPPHKKIVKNVYWVFNGKINVDKINDIKIVYGNNG